MLIPRLVIASQETSHQLKWCCTVSFHLAIRTWPVASGPSFINLQETNKIIITDGYK